MAQITVDVPDDLIARIVAAARVQFPETATMSPAQVGKYFLRHAVRDLVARTEESQAIDAVRSAGKVARDKAWADTQAIT